MGGTPLKIYVAKGVYKPKYKLADRDFNNNPTGERDKTFLLVKDVLLYGGFDPAKGVRTLDDARILPSAGGGTILSGDIDNNDNPDGTISGANAYHVLVSAGAVGGALLNGFTIQGGSANDLGLLQANGADIYRNSGGGICVISSSPTLTSVNVRNNQADSGGGMYNENCFSALTEVNIDDNKAIDGYGGGMYNNRGSSPYLTDVSIRRNMASNDGGGMYNEVGSSPVLMQVLVVGNRAVGDGGGLYFRESSSPSLTQVTISANEAGGYGGGMMNYASLPTINNSILYGNTSGTGDNNLMNSNSTPIFWHSLMEGVVWDDDWGTNAAGNKLTNDDPFADAAAGDYRLGAGSAAIGIGNNSLFVGVINDAKDLAGGMRLVGANIDAGAYEYQCGAVTPPSADATQSFCAADMPTVADLVADGAEIVWYTSVSGADSYAVTDALEDGKTYYASQMSYGCESDTRTAVKVTLVATPDAPTVVDLEYTYGDVSQPLTAGVSSGNTLLWYADTLGGTALAGAPRPATDTVGLQEFWLSQVNALGCESLRTKIRVAVVRAPLSISVNADQNKVYGEADPALTYEVTLLLAGTLPNGASVTYTNNIASNAGTYDATANIDGGNNYESFALTAKLTINKATITGITFPDRELTYDGSAKTLLLMGTLPGGASVAYTNNTATNAGTYGATANIDGGNNYESFALTAKLTINKAIITGITFSDRELTYDGSANALLLAGTLPSDASVTYTNNIATNAGTYNATANIDGGNNYESFALTAKLTISKATITGITFPDRAFVYDSSAKTLLLAGALPSGASVAYTNNTATNSGTYNATANIDGGNNYESFALAAKLTINKATITGISFPDRAFVYDSSAKTLLLAGTLPGGASVAYTNNIATNAGTYVATANIDGGNNYESFALTAKLTINKATITGITFPDRKLTYDGSAKTLLLAGTLPGGASVTYTNNTATNAGTYDATANIDGGNNYESFALTAKLTINKATITGISFPDRAFVYDGIAHSLSIGGTLPAGASVSYEDNININTGSYPVKAIISGGNNYESFALTAKLTISKATITGITFPDRELTYDGSAKTLLLAGTLPDGASVTYTNNTATNAGMYSATANIDGGNNYESFALTAKLTISKASQTINFPATTPLSRDARDVALGAAASSGLPVSYTLDDPLIAEIVDGKLRVLRLGTVTVTATQGGNANYEAAAAVMQRIKISAAADAPLPIIVHQALSPNGDGINEFLMLEGIGDYPDNKVTIFDKTGKVLAVIEGYNNQDKVFSGRDQHDGTYYYYVDVEDKGEIKRQKGFFVIKR